MPRLTKEQELYIRHLTENLTNEFHVINEALSGRAPRRTRLSEKAYTLIGYVGELTAAAATLGVAVPFIAATKGMGMLLNKGIGYLYDRSKLEVLAPISDAYFDRTPDARAYLIDEVAKDAAYIYEYALMNLIYPEDIPLFARIGAKRIKEYLETEQYRDLSEAILLQGLVRGTSGTGVQELGNNPIRCKDNSNETLSAEGLYGRAAYRTPDNQLWANADRNRMELRQQLTRWGRKILGNAQVDSHFGWVALDDEGMPTYGYRLATQEEVDALKYERFTPIPNTKVAQQFQTYKPFVHWVNEEQIIAYMRKHRKKNISFNHYLNYHGAIARFSGLLENVDLSGGDFSNVDFSDAEFVNCKLDHCNFSNANLTRVQLLEGSTATHIQLIGAQCAHLQAENIDFSHANFNAADLYYANIEGATLEGATQVGCSVLNAIISNDIPQVEHPSLQYAEEANAVLVRLKSTAPYYSAEQLNLWLNLQVQAMIAAEIVILPPRLRNQIALIARNEIDHLNSKPVFTFYCALITKNGLTTEQYKEIDDALAVGNIHTPFHQRQLRKARALAAQDCTMDDHNQISQSLIPKLQISLSLLSATLEEELNLTVRINLSNTDVNSISTWVGIIHSPINNSPLLERLSWQQAIWLGGNPRLFDQFIQDVNEIKYTEDIKNILQKLGTNQGLIEPSPVDDTWLVNIDVYVKWQHSIYYFASLHQQEWDTLKELFPTIAAHILKAPNLLIKYCNHAWSVLDQEVDAAKFAQQTHAIIAHEEVKMLKTIERIYMLWTQILNGYIKIFEVSAHPSNYLLQDSIQSANWQPYFTFFAWQWLQADGDDKRQEVLKQWQGLYESLTQDQQFTYMQALDGIANQDGVAYPTLFNHLLYISRNNGWHYNLVHSRQKWLSLWREAVTTTDGASDQNITLKTPHLTLDNYKTRQVQTHVVKSQVTEIFIDDKKAFKSPNSNEGLHPVYRIEQNGLTFWGRCIPDQGAIEYAVNELMKRLLGKSYLPETMMSLAQIPGRETPIAIQWSQHITGTPLRPSLDDAPRLQQISHPSFVTQLMRGIISGPEDDSYWDYRTVPNPDNANQIDLLRLDFDRSFYHPDLKGSFLYNNTLLIKSMVLCLDNMLAPINLKDPVITRFLTLDPLEVLGDWLDSLEVAHEQYRNMFSIKVFEDHFEDPLKLFTPDELKKLFPKGNKGPLRSMLTMHIGKTLLIELNKRIGALQTVLQYHLSEGIELTGLDLLMAVHPELGQYYKEIFIRVQYQDDNSVSGLSPKTIKIMQDGLGITTQELHQYKHLLPWMRFWERTHTEYTYASQLEPKSKNTHAAPTSTLRLPQSLSLNDAEEIHAGIHMCPQEAKKAKASLHTQQGYVCLQALKSPQISTGDFDKEKQIFSNLSIRQKNILLRKEIEKINEAYFLRAACENNTNVQAPQRLTLNSGMVVPMDNDRNSLFDGVLHQLNSIDHPQKKLTDVELRSLAVAHMRANLATYIPLISLPPAKIDRYLARMSSRPGEYGSTIEIKALAEVLNICIYVVQPDGVGSISYGNPSCPAIYLWNADAHQYHALSLYPSSKWQNIILALLPGTTLRTLDLSGFGEVLDDEKLRRILTTRPDYAQQAQNPEIMPTGHYIRTLDLSHNKKITADALSIIAEGCPYITSLILDNTQLEAVMANSSLWKYEVLFPRLEYLSIKNCKKLTRIYLQAPRLVQVYADNCENLEVIRIYSLHGKAVLNGCTKLHDHKDKATLFFTVIDLSKLSPLVQDKLRLWISKEYTRSNLTLEDVDLTPANVIAISAALNWGDVPTVTLGRRNLLNHQLKELFSLCTASHIRFSFWGRLLGRKGAKVLVEALEYAHVSQLDWGLNNLDDAGVERIATVLNSTTITHLDLSWNHITDKGAQRLLDVLKNNKTLVHINLEGNPISKHLLQAINAYPVRNRDRQILLSSANIATSTSPNSSALPLPAQQVIFDDNLLPSNTSAPAYLTTIQKFRVRAGAAITSSLLQAESPAVINSILATALDTIESSPAVSLNHLYEGVFSDGKELFSPGIFSDGRPVFILGQLEFSHESAASALLAKKDDATVREKFAADIFDYFISNEKAKMTGHASEKTPDNSTGESLIKKYIYCSSAWENLRIKLTCAHPELIGLPDSKLLENIPQQSTRAQAENLYRSYQEAQTACKHYCASVEAYVYYITEKFKGDLLFTANLILQLAEEKGNSVCIWACSNDENKWQLDLLKYQQGNNTNLPLYFFLKDGQISCIEKMTNDIHLQIIYQEIKAEQQAASIQSMPQSQASRQIIRYIYFSLYNVCILGMDTASMQQWMRQSYALLRALQLSYPDSGDPINDLCAHFKRALETPPGQPVDLALIEALFHTCKSYFEIKLENPQALFDNLFGYHTQHMIQRHEQLKAQAQSQVRYAVTDLTVKIPELKALFAKKNAALTGKIVPEHIIKRIYALLQRMVNIEQLHQGAHHPATTVDKMLALRNFIVTALLLAPTQSLRWGSHVLSNWNPNHLNFLNVFLANVELQLDMYEYAYAHKEYYLLELDPLHAANVAYFQAHCPSVNAMANIAQQVQVAATCLRIDPVVQQQSYVQIQGHITSFLPAATLPTFINPQIFSDLCDILFNSELKNYRWPLLQLLLSSPWQLPVTIGTDLAPLLQLQVNSLIKQDLDNRSIVKKSAVKFIFTISWALQQYHGLTTSVWSLLTNRFRSPQYLSEREASLMRLIYICHQQGLLKEGCTAKEVLEALDKELEKIKHEPKFESRWFQTQSRLLCYVKPALEASKVQVDAAGSQSIEQSIPDHPFSGTGLTVGGAPHQQNTKNTPKHIALVQMGLPITKDKFEQEQKDDQSGIIATAKL